LAILCLLVKLDFGGFGSTVLKPILKDIPYVNLILPDTVEDDIKENEQYPYATLADAIEQIKYLELQIQELQESSGSAEVAALKAEVKRLKAFEEAQTKFETARKEFYEEVVFGNKAPSVEEYKKYYESIDAANAQELYKQVVKQIEQDKQVQEYASTYASMKPKQAAAAMEQMGDDMKLVAKILNNIDVESRAKIMDAFSADFAAKITKIMEP
jgi:flagellar motility protein MotE (MotC chaperone)